VIGTGSTLKALDTLQTDEGGPWHRRTIKGRAMEKGGPGLPFAAPSLAPISA